MHNLVLLTCLGHQTDGSWGLTWKLIRRRRRHGLVVGVLPIEPITNQYKNGTQVEIQ